MATSPITITNLHCYTLQSRAGIIAPLLFYSSICVWVHRGRGEFDDNSTARWYLAHQYISLYFSLVLVVRSNIEPQEEKTIINFKLNMKMKRERVRVREGIDDESCQGQQHLFMVTFFVPSTWFSSKFYELRFEKEGDMTRNFQNVVAIEFAFVFDLISLPLFPSLFLFFHALVEKLIKDERVDDSYSVCEKTKRKYFKFLLQKLLMLTLISHYR